MDKITKLREISRHLKWMRTWFRQNHHSFTELYLHIIETQQRVEELIAEEKKNPKGYESYFARHEESVKNSLPHFKRAEFVFAKFVEEGSKWYKLKSWANVANNDELPYSYVSEPYAFYETSPETITIKGKGKRTVEVSKDCILTDAEFGFFVEIVEKAGERLHNIMKREREIAQHRGEHRITI